MNPLWLKRLNGTIEIQPLGKPRIGTAEFRRRVSSYARYLWVPPYQISKLPPWFKLALDCYTTETGIRRFILVELSQNELGAKHLGLQNIATTRGLALVASIGGYRLMRD